MYVGDFTAGATVRHSFNTHKADGTPATLSGTPVCKVYKDGSTTTEATTGVTLTVDFDSITGLNEIAVDTSADGTFYAAGSDYKVLLTAGTVDSVSVVGSVVMRFSIANRRTEAVVGYIDTEVAAIKAKTDNLPAAPAATGDIPTAAAIAAAWGSRVLGNGRTADMYLQGLTNLVSFAADGLTWTLYATDDVTPLATGTSTRLSTSVGGLRSVDPA